LFPRSTLIPCILLAALAIPSSLLAVDPEKDISQYNHRVWLKKDGLPQNSVISLAQTPDGYLWVGTFEGLARFDGLAFKVYNPLNTPALEGKSVSSLFVARDGTLWIGVDGFGLTTMRKGEFRRISIAKPEEPLRVGPMYQDRAGHIWAATSMALITFRGDSVEKAYTMADGLLTSYVTSMTEDSAGNFLVTSGGELLVLRNNCFVRFVDARTIGGKARVVAGDPEGGVWVGTFEDGVTHLGPGGIRRFGLAQGLSSTAVTSLRLDSRGAVWVGTMGGGVSRIFRGKISAYTAKSGLSGDDVYPILEDREGNIWAGLLTGGLNCFVEGKFTTFVIGTTAPQNFVYSLYQDRSGALLAGTASREVMLYAHGRFAPHPLFPAPLRGFPAAFHRDREGRFWVGTSGGLYRFAGGRLDHFPLGFVTSIMEDARGKLWIGSARGLFYMQDGRINRYAAPFQGEFADVRSIVQDGRGRMWVGTRNLGLLRFTPPHDPARAGNASPADLLWYAKGDGLGSDWVTSLLLDPDGSLWVTTAGGGLCLVRNERVKNLTYGGLPEGDLLMLVDDCRGSFWLSSNNGVFRVKRDDLEQYASGARLSYAWTRYGMGAGMATDECNGAYQSAGLRTKDGNIWFPTALGAVMVDPDSLPANMVPPAVLLERVRIGKREVSPAAPFTAPPGDGDLEFAYAGISMSAPDLVQYRVMLAGFDKGWVDVGTRRVCSFTNIAPGSYTFRVQARNADGVWNEAGASFPLTIEPYFYQTSWFILVCILTVMMAGAGLHAAVQRDRDRQLVAAQLESQLARAQLRVLEMQVQPHFLFNALNGIGVLIREDPGRATRMITRLSEFVRMALDRSGVQEISLREELTFVDRYLSIELLRFGDRLTVRQAVHDELLDALVPTMILQPLVENAIRHGVSKRRGQVTIRIEASRENGTLNLHVRDDGAGIPAAGVEGLREGIGLTNTRARLHQLYGDAHRFELSSHPEGGVDVELAIPFHKEPV
jgi:ligand-binding sensor domain-containing protein